MVKVTLYIPCYNAEKFIEGCIESLLAQTLRPDEIIIVNDGSTDGTVRIARSLPVRMINLESHPGLAAARNAALEAACGEYIAAIDADCVPEPTWLEALMNALVGGNASGAGGMLIEAYQVRLADRWRAVHQRQNWGEERIIDPPFLFGCNTLFRKCALQEVGGYDTSFRTNGEDVNISNRLMEKGHTLIYEPSAVVRHLKQDTILSVLKADWNWGYITCGENEKFEKNSNIVYHNFTNAKYRFLKDLSLGRLSLLPVDTLLFFFHTYLDIRHARTSGIAREQDAWLGSRIGTLTGFHSHLARLSESRFLRTPDSINPRGSEMCGPPAKILFALFGAMGDIFNGLPVVRALKGKYPDAELTWLTLPLYKKIAESSAADRVLTRGTGRHGQGIPRELLESEQFDLIFFPQGSFNHDEWERSGLHMVDFMAEKCGVHVSSRAPEITIEPEIRKEADILWKKHGLSNKKVIAIACTALSCRPWPQERFTELSRKLSKKTGTTTLHIGGDDAPSLPGSIDFRCLPIKTGIELIQRCDLFIGCDSGPTWMASCTDTPIIVFIDPERQKDYNVGFAHVMKDKDITELSIGTTVEEAEKAVNNLIKKRSSKEKQYIPDNNIQKRELDDA